MATGFVSFDAVLAQWCLAQAADFVRSRLSEAAITGTHTRGRLGALDPVFYSAGGRSTVPVTTITYKVRILEVLGALLARCSVPNI